MPITGYNKTVNSQQITCSESTEVTLSITGESGITTIPTDIMLVLDRSGSMAPAFADLQNAVAGFVDIIDEETDGIKDGIIAGGSHVGVVSFATSATLDEPLTTDANQIITTVNGLSAGGFTNVSSGIYTATNELSVSLNKKVMIIFADGNPNRGGNPVTGTTPIEEADIAAAQARNDGIEIIGIGLGNNIDYNLILNWVGGDPNRVFSAPTASDLQSVFDTVGLIISEPAATNIEIQDTVNSDFLISNISADMGNPPILSGNNITWNIDVLGTGTATMTYTITHDPSKGGGIKLVNPSIIYNDDQGHQIDFPDPKVIVNCNPSTRKHSGSTRGLSISSFIDI